MKRWLCRLLLAIGIAALLTGNCYAAEETLWDAVHPEELEDAAEESGVSLELGEDFDLSAALGSVADCAAEQLRGACRAAAGSGLVLLVVVLFCETADAAAETVPETHRVTAVIGTLAVTAVSVTDVSSLMGLGQQTVEQINTFADVLLPVVAACCAAGGSVSASAVRETATVFFSDLLLHLIRQVLIPFVYLYVAASAAGTMVENRGLKEIAALLKWAVTAALTTVLLLFTGYLSLTQAAAAGTDAAAIKLTRTVISGMVPVVGGILSNATETVLSGVAVVKNLVGTFGAAAVLAFCVVPFLRLGVQYLMYRLVSVLAAAMSKGKLPELIGEIADAFGLVLGMTGTAALLVMISIFSALTVAVG